MKTLFAIVGLWLWLALAVGAQTAAPEAVDIDALLKDTLAHGKGDKLLSEYTYILRWHERRTDKQGAVKEVFELYESYIPTLKRQGNTSAVMLKLTEHGVPLPPEKVEKERQKAAERLLKAETESQKYNSRAQEEESRSKGAYFTIRVGRSFGADVQLNVRALLEGCEFGNARRTLLDGRETISLEFRSMTGVQFSGELRYLAQLSGTVWIDAAERVLMRVEGWPRDLAVRSGKPALLYEQMPLPDGYWLPRQAQLNGDTYRAFFERAGNRLGVDYSFEFADFKRFGTETQDVKLKAPERKP
ncbi:MAG: hypothetical protein HY011_19100 [Acidobacteria bacterium]|nr:hypothetical protein [Acidobacteriota bacterium]